MHGCEIDGLPDDLRKLIEHLTHELARLERRMDTLEAQLRSQLQNHVDTVEKRSVRTGELASRVAQRVARLESCVEMMGRMESAGQMDHA